MDGNITTQNGDEGEKLLALSGIDCGLPGVGLHRQVALERCAAALGPVHPTLGYMYLVPSAGTVSLHPSSIQFAPCGTLKLPREARSRTTTTRASRSHQPCTTSRQVGDWLSPYQRNGRYGCEAQVPRPPRVCIMSGSLRSSSALRSFSARRLQAQLRLRQCLVVGCCRNYTSGKNNEFRPHD